MGGVGEGILTTFRSHSLLCKKHLRLAKEGEKNVHKL